MSLKNKTFFIRHFSPPTSLNSFFRVVLARFLKLLFILLIIIIIFLLLLLCGGVKRKIKKIK